jgi:MFS family permease
VTSTTAPSALIGIRESRLVHGINSYFFYGWVIVAMGFIAQMLTSLSIQGLSTYVGPLEREFGWSASATAAGRSFQQADSFLGPVNGWLVDRFGPRRLMTAGVVLYMFSFVLFSQVDSLLAFYGACFLMALSNSLVGLLVVSFSLNRWFRRKRTTAMGLAVMGLAAAGIVFIPLIVWAQSTFGWRAAAFGTGIGMLLIGLPIMLLMRNSPEAHGLLPDGDRAGHLEATNPAHARGGGLVDFTLRQAMSTRAFWLIMIGTSLANLAQSGIIVHQFPHLEELLSRETAALVLSEVNVFNLAGRLLGGMLGDRLPKNVLMGTNLIGATVSLLVLAVASSLPLLLVYGAFFGFSWGVRTAVSNSLQGDYFGRSAFGQIAGMTQTLASPAAIVAPILVGLGVDFLGGYQVPFLLLAIVSGFGSLMFFLARRPPDPSMNP